MDSIQTLRLNTLAGQTILSGGEEEGGGGASSNICCWQHYTGR